MRTCLYCSASFYKFRIVLSCPLPALLVCSLCSSAASACMQPLEGVVPAHQGNDRSEPPLRPLDYLPLKNNARHRHGSLAAQVTVFARAPGDVKSIGSHAVVVIYARTSNLNTNAHRPLLIAFDARGKRLRDDPPVAAEQVEALRSCVGLRTSAPSRNVHPRANGSAA